MLTNMFFIVFFKLENIMKLKNYSLAMIYLFLIDGLVYGKKY